MGEAQLTKRGRILILVPVYLMVLGFLLQNPFTVLIAASLLSFFIYSRIYLYKAYSTFQLKETLGSGMKTVDNDFILRQDIQTRRPLLIKAQPSNEEGILVKSEIKEYAYTPVEYRHRLNPHRRGYLKVGGLRGWVFDPMKLYTIHIDIAPDNTVTIHSSKDAIRRARSYAKRSHIEELVKDFHMYTTTSGELEEIREYNPGDRLRDMHWKSFSKFQRYMTKVYEKMAMVQVHVLLDCGPSMRRYTHTEANKLEHSIFVSLEILKKFEIAGHDISFTAFDHKSLLTHHPPSHRGGTYQTIFEGMSDLPPPIRSDGYTGMRYSEEVDQSVLLEAEKEFAKRVGGVLGGAPGEISGIVNAVRTIGGKVNKRKLVVIISDLEMNVGLTVKAVEKLKALGNVVWVIVPFSPWYEVKDPTVDHLEMAYNDYENMERSLLKLHRAGASVFELFPKKEGLKILLERRGDNR